jgi:SSS family solute:Na+ symporter
MLEKALVVGAYFMAILFVGIYSRRYAEKTTEDFFLAGRSIGPVLLFFTMAATNFSAFTVFGFSGAGYRMGYSFYPIMGFGTGFMAITFSFVGKRVWELGITEGYMTPAELIGKQYQSRILRLLFFLVMVVFTLPYIAIQPISAGYTLESMLGIPYFAGAVIVMGVIVIYVFVGGLRGVVWTDVLQGGMMILLLVSTLLIVAAPHGGLIQANLSVLEKSPEFFSRPGPGNVFPIGIWFSYMLLWLLCDPLFPQLFQRFFAARDRRSLDVTMLLYPVITGFLFLLPVAIGVIGRLSVPGLEGKEADRILPLLMGTMANNWFGTLVLTAGLAALMSTLDSQLLTLSSMFTRDVTKEPLDEDKQRWMGKVFVLFLAVTGLAIAYDPPSTILKIATQTFTGLAVLFPTLIGGLYWGRASALGGILSILVGEALLIMYAVGWLPTFGFLPVVPILAVTSMVFVLVCILHSSKRGEREGFGNQRSRGAGVGKRTIAAFIAFGILFLLGMDYWSWGSTTPFLLGFPWWVWYFVGLNGLLIVAMAVFLRD